MRKRISKGICQYYEGDHDFLFFITFRNVFPCFAIHSHKLVSEVCHCFPLTFLLFICPVNVLFHKLSFMSPIHFSCQILIRSRSVLFVFIFLKTCSLVTHSSMVLSSFFCRSTFLLTQVYPSSVMKLLRIPCITRWLLLHSNSTLFSLFLTKFSWF